MLVHSAVFAPRKTSGRAGTYEAEAHKGGLTLQQRTTSKKRMLGKYSFH